jgi:cytoskeleton protein RodZ
MNDKSEEHQEQAQQYLSPESPGQRLRQAREAAGLTRGEVALHMRINERKVTALEEDNYELFPSETFVSGYLRSYAKVLGLPEGDFVRPVSSTQLPPSLTPTSSDQKQASSMDLPVRMVTYVIIAVIIASVAMWWVSQRHKVVTEPGEQISAIEDQVNQTTDNVATVAPQEAPELSSETATDDAVTGDAMHSAMPSEPVGEVKRAVNESAEPAVSPKPESVQPAQPAQQDPAMPPLLVKNSATAASPSTVAPETETAPAPPPLTDDMPQSKLVLEYQQESWTEVDDSAGRRLVYGLMQAGQTVELKGEAPFKIFLGYAKGVTIYYNSKLFDHSAFQRGDVARFHVGRAEQNQPATR